MAIKAEIEFLDHFARCFPTCSTTSSRSARVSTPSYSALPRLVSGATGPATSQAKTNKTLLFTHCWVQRRKFEYKIPNFINFLFAYLLINRAETKYLIHCPKMRSLLQRIRLDRTFELLLKHFRSSFSVPKIQSWETAVQKSLEAKTDGKMIRNFVAKSTK